MTKLTHEDTIEKQILVTCQVSPCDEPVEQEIVDAAALHAISHAVRHMEGAGFVHDAAAELSIGIVAVEELPTNQEITIVVEDGCVIDVQGLPEGGQYTIEDRDG